VEIELSLWEDNVLKNGVLETCGELGIPVIAYSPLGRGFLTGQLKSFDDLDPSDMRRHYPRFSKENFPKNLELVNQLEGIARAKGVTAAQLALAWVRQLGDKPRMPTIIPIPGATSKERVNENMDVKARQLTAMTLPTLTPTQTLTENELKSVDKVLATFTASMLTPVLLTEVCVISYSNSKQVGHVTPSS
jgi:aryl-alcohol dehydrogenase-like predicted oxidoreductase